MDVKTKERPQTAAKTAITLLTEAGVDTVEFDGGTVAQYWDKAGLAAPSEGYVAVMDGRRLEPSAVLPAGSVVTVSREVKNG